MTEEEFKEQFPELVKEPDVIKCGAVILQDIQKYCFSKKKVKEAIDKIYNSRKNTCSAEWMDFANDLEKELGLE